MDFIFNGFGIYTIKSYLLRLVKLLKLEVSIGDWNLMDLGYARKFWKVSTLLNRSCYPTKKKCQLRSIFPGENVLSIMGKGIIITNVPHIYPTLKP